MNYKLKDPAEPAGTIDGMDMMFHLHPYLGQKSEEGQRFKVNTQKSVPATSACVH